MKAYLLLALLAGAAASSHAQYREPFGQPWRGQAPYRQIDQLQRLIEHDFRYGIIDRADWQRLLSDARRLRGVAYEYGRDDFSSWERSDLAQQVERLHEDLMDATKYRVGNDALGRRSDPPPYYTDRGDRSFDPDADRGSQFDNDRDDTDRQDYEDSSDEGGGDVVADYPPDDDQSDRDPDQGAIRYEPGGGYPDALHVGDQAPVNLGLLPPELRSRYPDGRDYYYRYWNGTIYQVDEATGTIRWIGPVQR